MAQTSEDSDERQLPASERKLREARENGQIPRSREASHAAALLAAIATVAMYGPHYADRALALVRNGLNFDRVVAREPKAALSFAAASFNEAFWATLPLLLAPVLAGVMATMAVGGLVFSMKVVGPNFSKIDPMAGIARLFSMDSLIDVGKLALIAAAVGTVGGCNAFGSLERYASYAGMPLSAALATAGADLRSGMLAVCAVVIVVAFIDGPLQIWRHHKKLRMTAQEAKEEFRQSEGDPHIKAKVRQRQREMSRGRMLAAVPSASVVVTNPTHFAVALKYDETGMAAPRVIAKGADLLAARIREIAAESGVPMLEAPPLARALFKHVELDQEIPAVLYSAVAQVLAWVYQLQQNLNGGGALPREPGIAVPKGMDPQETER